MDPFEDDCDAPEGALCKTDTECSVVVDCGVLQNRRALCHEINVCIVVESEIYQLAYVSGATSAFSLNALRRLAGSAARSNRLRSITGMLLYHNQRFLQVLEGDRRKVSELFFRICQDERHHSVLVLMQRSVPFRQFPVWSMKLAQVDKIETRQGEIHAQLFPSPLQNAQSRQLAADTWALVNAFNHT